MADTTARYGFPYQEPTDPPDGAGLGQDLAQAVEDALGDLEDRGRLFLQQVRFTASGAFVKAGYPTARLARVRVQAAGGAGGGAPATGAGVVSCGNGGQAGAYAESLLDVSTLAASVTVTIGAAGTSAAGAAGSNGSPSSFGTHVVAGGGVGGAVVPAGGTPFATTMSAGAPPMTGDITAAGGYGTHGIRLGSAAGQVVAGTGGSSILGGGGMPGANAAGGTGTGYGSGGGGASRYPSSAALSGGSGAPGIIIIDLYA
jgi:hypothetical protein